MFQIDTDQEILKWPPSGRPRWRNYSNDHARRVKRTKFLEDPVWPSDTASSALEVVPSRSEEAHKEGFAGKELGLG